MNISKITNINLMPVWDEEIDVKLALKYFVLFSRHEETNIILISDKHIETSLEYLSKMNFEHTLYLLEDDLFDALYQKFMEIKTEKDSQSTSEIETINEDETSLNDILQNDKDIMDSENAAPVIKLVNTIFYQAIKQKASDIHIEMHEDTGEIRFRIHGILSVFKEIKKSILLLVISRIKVISGLDISEKRIPQDGRTSIVIANKKLDVRISILPTYHGERVVMRILMQSDQIPSLIDLGFKEDLTKQFEPLLKHSHGLILVTGPTGSGKSTTLHSFLQTIATPDKNIVTIEDPVEYNAKNINQTQVSEKVGLSFPTALKSILRQDPDVIMVGEIRDKQTAQISVQAALTGHLVFSTLHTNTAVGTLTRLIDMEIPSFLVNNVLLGVLSQRLVRVLCPKCKIKNGNAYEARGCEHCSFLGYSGRVAVGELFVMDNEVREFMKTHTQEHEIEVFMQQKSMIKIL